LTKVYSFLAIRKDRIVELKKSVNLGLPSMMRKREKEGRSLYLNP
jgi:hypothetical protein